VSILEDLIEEFDVNLFVVEVGSVVEDVVWFSNVEGDEVVCVMVEVDRLEICGFVK